MMKWKYGVYLVLSMVCLICLPQTQCQYVVDDATLQVTAKDGTGTKINGSLPLGTDGDGTYIQFNGTASNYIKLDTTPAIPIASEGVHIVFRAKWEAFNNWSRIFDCGNGMEKNIIFIANNGTSSTLSIGLNPGTSHTELNANISGALSLNTLQHWDITVGANSANAITAKRLSPSATTYTPAKAGSASALDNITRSSCYIGKSNWSDAGFKGKIYYVLVESAVSKQQLFEFDASRML